MTEPAIGRQDVRRRWLLRISVAVAAVASVATSRPSWTLKADLPAELQKPVPAGRAYLISVKASGAPVVRAAKRSAYRTLQPDPLAPKSPGAQTYLLPPGWKVENVSIGGRDCGSTGCCQQCSPPDDAQVEVTDVAKLDAWTLESESKVIKSTVDSQHLSACYDAVIEASEAVNLEVIPQGKRDNQIIAKHKHDADLSAIDGGKRSRYEVCWRWNRTDPPDQKISVSWKLRASFDRICRGGSACKSNRGDFVRAGDVKAR